MCYAARGQQNIGSTLDSETPSGSHAGCPLGSSSGPFDAMMRLILCYRMRKDSGLCNKPLWPFRAACRTSLPSIFDGHISTFGVAGFIESAGRDPFTHNPWQHVLKIVQQKFRTSANPERNFGSSEPNSQVVIIFQQNASGQKQRSL